MYSSLQRAMFGGSVRRMIVAARWASTTKPLTAESVLSSGQLDVRRARLLYRSRKRGIREMDFILGRFADAHLSAMSEPQLGEYEALIADASINEWDLYYYITGVKPIPAELATGTFELLRDFTYHNKLRQPSLKPSNST